MNPEIRNAIIDFALKQTEDSFTGKFLRVPLSQPAPYNQCDQLMQYDPINQIQYKTVGLGECLQIIAELYNEKYPLPLEYITQEQKAKNDLLQIQEKIKELQKFCAKQESVETINIIRPLDLE